MSRLAALLVSLLGAASAACGGTSDIGHAPVSDPPVHDAPVSEATMRTYHVARAGSFTGSSAMIAASCTGADAIYLGECVANDGAVTTSIPYGRNGWSCEATPNVEAKGQQIVLWLTCVRATH